MELSLTGCGNGEALAVELHSSKDFLLSLLFWRLLPVAPFDAVCYVQWVVSGSIRLVAPCFSLVEWCPNS